MVLKGYTEVYYNKGYLIVMKAVTALSLRGGQKRSARRGNLLVPSIEMHSSIDALYREIVPKGIPFGPTSLRSSQ